MFIIYLFLCFYKLLIVEFNVLYGVYIYGGVHTRVYYKICFLVVKS
jgi:hypothetical protein